MGSTQDLARVSLAFPSPTCQSLTRFPILPTLTFLSVYYYFYEGGRTAILKSRNGSKGLSTFESLLNGCIAGRSVHLRRTPKYSHHNRRFCHGDYLQPIVGRPNPSNS